MPGIKHVFHYLRLIVSKWVLWLFVVLDIVAAVTAYFWPTLRLPLNVYGLLAIIGIGWAGFQVYTQSRLAAEKQMDVIVGQLKERESQLKQLDGQLNVKALLKTPSINLALQEGHEYTFFLRDAVTQEAMPAVSSEPGGASQNGLADAGGYELPQAVLTLFLRIENLGCALDILTLEVEWKSLGAPFLSLGAEAYTDANQAIRYPLHLDADEVVSCQLVVLLLPTTYQTQAQFASRLRDVRDRPEQRTAIVSTEVADPTGKRLSFMLEAHISLNPLMSLYITHWRTANREDLIKLAGVGL